MKTLPQIFRELGWSFSQIERNERFAIYRRWKNPDHPHYEVIKVQRYCAKPGFAAEDGESYPGARLWGKSGWTYSGPNAQERAFQKYTALCQGNVQKSFS